MKLAFSILAKLENCQDESSWKEIGPIFIDYFGHKVNWTNENDGWTEEGRKNFLEYNLRNKGDIFLTQNYSDPISFLPMSDILPECNLIFTGWPFFTSVLMVRENLSLMSSFKLSNESQSVSVAHEFCMHNFDIFA